MPKTNMIESHAEGILLLRASRAIDDLLECLQGHEGAGGSLTTIVCGVSLLLAETVNSDLAAFVRTAINDRLDEEEAVVESELDAWPPPAALTPDVTTINHGTLIGFTPKSEEARRWIESNVSDDSQWFGGALMVEARFADTLREGMEGDGLVVE